MRLTSACPPSDHWTPASRFGKAALLKAFACIPVSWVLALVVLGMVALLALVVITGLNFFTA